LTLVCWWRFDSSSETKIGTASAGFLQRAAAALMGSTWTGDLLHVGLGSALAAGWRALRNEISFDRTAMGIMPG